MLGRKEAEENVLAEKKLQILIEDRSWELVIFKQINLFRHKFWASNHDNGLETQIKWTISVYIRNVVLRVSNC